MDMIASQSLFYIVLKGKVKIKGICAFLINKRNKPLMTGEFLDKAGDIIDGELVSILLVFTLQFE
jgi:hypothetical protein